MRVKLALPNHWSFVCTIPVRITDLNYGNHVGNDSILSILHEARLQYLQHIKCNEIDFFGVSLIMADVAISFKNEGFYGDKFDVYVQASEPTKAGFSLYYKICKNTDTIVAEAKTGMVCFDYTQRKISPLPEAFLEYVK